MEQVKELHAAKAAAEAAKTEAETHNERENAYFRQAAGVYGWDGIELGTGSAHFRIALGIIAKLRTQLALAEGAAAGSSADAKQL